MSTASIHSKDVFLQLTTVIEDLEIPDDPIGQFFRVGNEWCKIVGVIEKRGELLGFSQDNFVLLPYGTAKRIMGASRDLDIQIQCVKRPGYPDPIVGG